MPQRIQGREPRATPGFDASGGLMLSWEVALVLGVDMKTVRRWARDALAAAESGQPHKIPVLLTPGGDWRFSRVWVLERLAAHGG